MRVARRQTPNKSRHYLSAVIVRHGNSFRFETFSQTIELVLRERTNRPCRKPYNYKNEYMPHIFNHDRFS
jgi:hypothetical protein